MSVIPSPSRAICDGMVVCGFIGWAHAEMYRNEASHLVVMDAWPLAGLIRILSHGILDNAIDAWLSSLLGIRVI